MSGAKLRRDAARWRELDRFMMSGGNLQCNAGGWALLRLSLDLTLDEREHAEARGEAAAPETAPEPLR